MSVLIVLVAGVAFVLLVARFSNRGGRASGTSTSSTPDTWYRDDTASGVSCTTDDGRNGEDGRSDDCNVTDGDSSSGGDSCDAGGDSGGGDGGGGGGGGGGGD